MNKCMKDVEQQPDFFLKYLDGKFENMKTQFDTIHKRIDSLEKNMSARMSIVETKVEVNTTEIQSAKSTGKALKWTWAIVGGLILFIIARAEFIIGLLKK